MKCGRTQDCLPNSRSIKLMEMYFGLKFSEVPELYTTQSFYSDCRKKPRLNKVSDFEGILLLCLLHSVLTRYLSKLVGVKSNINMKWEILDSLLGLDFFLE